MTWDGDWTAGTIRARVAAGEVDPAAATAEALQRIAARDGGIGAFRTVRAQAVDEAVTVDPRGPLAGVPVAIKDSIPVRGEALRNGSLATSDQPSPHDHPVVSRLRAAGAVVVGITTVPEMCTFGTTDGADGITRNPWDPERTAGGSSGGSAAAVAAAMVPIAHGADGMGSIRIPAACTGIVGIKPGTGVVPAELGVNDWSGMSENGVFATTIVDAALMLSVLADDDALREAREPERRLRIGLSFNPPVPGVLLDSHWAAAAGRAASILSNEGHHVVRTELSFADTSVTAAAVSALARWFVGVHDDTTGLDRERLQPRTRTHTRIGAAVKGTPAMGEGLCAAWRRRAERLFADVDVLVTPALAAPPPAARAWSQESWAANVWSNVQYAPYAAPWNLAGFPAMSVPMGEHPVSGTPVAAQLVAAPGGEALLLGVAATLERVRPWARTAA